MKKKTIFETIRKTPAPPTQHHKNRKKEEKSDKVGRKQKYKGKDDE